MLEIQTHLEKANNRISHGSKKNLARDVGIEMDYISKAGK